MLQQMCEKSWTLSTRPEAVGSVVFPAKLVRGAVSEAGNLVFVYTFWESDEAAE